LNRLFVVAVKDAGSFAQNFHRAHPRATGPQNVGIQNRKRRSTQILLGNFLDESWNINMRWASGRARSVETIQTTIGLRQRGNRTQRRVNFSKPLLDLRALVQVHGFAFILIALKPEHLAILISGAPSYSNFGPPTPAPPSLSITLYSHSHDSAAPLLAESVQMIG
jgi:hypothetical protein